MAMHLNPELFAPGTFYDARSTSTMLCAACFKSTQRLAIGPISPAKNVIPNPATTTSGQGTMGSSMGRFMSPDPSGLMYADPTNPQSLNLYSYVLNNPLKYLDPNGLSCYWDDGTHDDDPSDGGASQGDCANQGGTWIDKPTTFVQVTANPDNNDISTTSVTISTPLGYQQCQSAQFKVTGVGHRSATRNACKTDSDNLPAVDRMPEQLTENPTG
jgi:hypothetical protein